MAVTQSSELFAVLCFEIAELISEESDSQTAS